MEPISVIFHKEKDTPGTRKYLEEKPADGSRPAIGSLYLTKPNVEKLGNPETITVTVSAT